MWRAAASWRTRCCQFRAGKIRRPAKGAIEVEAYGVDARQFGACQIGAGQSCAGQPGTGEPCIRKFCVFQIEILVASASLKSAPVRSAPTKDAPSKFALVSVARGMRAPARSRPDKSSPTRSAAESDFLFTLTEPLVKPSPLSDCRARFEAMRRENHPTAEESKADADAAQAERSAAQAERDAAAQARVAEAVLANARQRADVALRKLNRTDGVEALPKRDPPADLLTAAAPGLASFSQTGPRQGGPSRRGAARRTGHAAAADPHMDARGRHRRTCRRRRSVSMVAGASRPRIRRVSLGNTAMGRWSWSPVWTLPGDQSS